MRCMLLPDRPVPHSARIMAFLVLSAELQRALQSQRTPISTVPFSPHECSWLDARNRGMWCCAGG